VLYLERDPAATTGAIDLWVSSWYVDSGAAEVAFTSKQDSLKCIASPATGNRVIRVGFYAEKTQWTNGNGGTSIYGGSLPTLHGIHLSSSPGPRRDGAQRPDVCATGYGLGAGLSRDISIPNFWRTEDAAHHVMPRTVLATTRPTKNSAYAAAVVTGIVALYLQSHPLADPEEIRAWLRLIAQADSFTGTVPNATWGHGKARAHPIAVEPPVLAMVASLIAPPSGQKFRLVPLNSATFKTASINAATVKCFYAGGGTAQYVLGNVTATTFDINTQEIGPEPDMQYVVDGVVDPNDRPFGLTGVRFDVDGAGSISAWR